MYNRLMIEEHGGKFSFDSCVKTIDHFKIWQKEYRNAIIDLLKITDLLEDRKPVEIVHCSEETTTKTASRIRRYNNQTKNQNKFLIEHFYLKSWEDSLIPVLVCIPDRSINDTLQSDRIPGFVCTHGHVMFKDNLVGLQRNFIYPGTWAKDFTEMGCVTVSMDQWGWGERGFPEWKIILKPFIRKIWESKYAYNMLQLGRTINGLRYFDAIRCIDYLLTRKDIDPSRIGIAGLSLGGSSAAWLGALDERISMSVIAGYLNTFKNTLIDLKHCSCMYTPGILQLGEMYDLISLIAPRPVCFITGKKDNIFPIDAARVAYDKVKRAYSLFNATENCVLDVTPKSHGWRGDVAYPFVKSRWFAK
jgi:hypothetical protein